MIFNPSPSNLVTEMLRRLFNRRVQDGVPALLGNGLGRVDVEGMQGFVYVRFTNNKNADGFALSGSLSIARSGDASYPYYDGAQVFVAYNYSGELEVKGANYSGMRQTGIDTRVLNQLNPQSKFVYPWQLTYGLVNVVATPTTDSLKAMMKWVRHFTGDVFADFDTPDDASKIDFSPYIPTSDMQCFAAVWIDTYTNTYSITTSTPQGLDDPLDLTDIQECVSGRPADAMPFKVVRLSNDQTTLKQSADESDLRQHMHTPPIWGWLRTLVNQERVRDNRTFIVPGDSDAETSMLMTLESGARLLAVHKSNLTNTAPTVTDDSDSGYSVGSYWFDTSTSTLYVATDVTVGAAVWDTVSSGGGGFAPDDATYLLQVANGSLPNAQAMGALSTGIVKNTTTTGVQSIATAGTDYTSPTGTENLSNKTITASSLVATALSVLIGGFKGIFTHSNSADRTYTLPNATGTIALTSDITSPPFVDTNALIKGSVDPTKLARFEVDGFTTGTTRVTTLPNYDGTMATLDGAETLTQKTLTTPTIADFTNAQHDHLDADDGGTLTPGIFGAQTANTFLAGPTSAGPSTPTFRAFNNLDLQTPVKALATLGSAGQHPVVNGGATNYIFVDGASSTFNAYSANDTWSKPSGAQWILVICIGGGGGGGSGRRGAASSNRFGGGGGAAGAITWAVFRAAQVSTGQTITIGTGGTGGAARSTDNTSGANGNDGTASSFGTILTAIGGLGGTGGGTAGAATGGVGNTVLGPSFQVYGSNGGNGGTNAATTAAAPGAMGPGGGGGGGGISSGNAAGSGADGASANAGYAAATTGGGGAAGVVNTAGNAGTAGTNGNVSGSSTAIAGAGGGGGAPNSGVGGNGGNGGSSGGGGGGGSGSTNGSNSGGGGNGGDGRVIVITFTDN